MQVLVQVPKPLLLEELVPVLMPGPSVDQTDLLTRLVPNPQLDQTELLPLSVLEQLSVLDPLLKVVPMCETVASCLVCYDQLSNLTRFCDRDPFFLHFF